MLDDGTTIVTAAADDARTSQQWKLVPVGDAYKMLSRHAGKSLSVVDASLAIGARIEHRGVGNVQSKRVHVRRAAGPLPTVSPRALRIERGDEAIRLPPLRAFERASEPQTSIELWVNPAQNKGNHGVLVWLGNDRHALSIHHVNKGVMVKVHKPGETRQVVRAMDEELLPGWQWTHVCLTLASDWTAVGGGNLVYRLKL